MPIFVYQCQACTHQFELLVQGSAVPSCPQCQALTLEKQLTGFAVGAADGEMNFSEPGGCGTCGDPRGPGACSMN